MHASTEYLIPDYSVWVCSSEQCPCSEREYDLGAWCTAVA